MYTKCQHCAELEAKLESLEAENDEWIQKWMDERNVKIRLAELLEREE